MFSTQHSTCKTIASDSGRDEVTCYAFTNEKRVFSLMHTLVTSCQIHLRAFGLPVAMNAAPTHQRTYSAPSARKFFTWAHTAQAPTCTDTCMYVAETGDSVILY